MLYDILVYSKWVNVVNVINVLNVVNASNVPHPPNSKSVYIAISLQKDSYLNLSLVD